MNEINHVDIFLKKEKGIELGPGFCSSSVVKSICSYISQDIEYPNRGLLQLLRMCPRILQKYPQATLHTFCDTKNSWCQ